VPGADLAGFTRLPHRGGDYYDFFPYAGSRVGLALGDVSQSMPASLMMYGPACARAVLPKIRRSGVVMTPAEQGTLRKCRPTGSSRFLHGDGRATGELPSPTPAQPADCGARFG